MRRNLNKGQLISFHLNCLQDFNTFTYPFQLILFLVKSNESQNEKVEYEITYLSLSKKSLQDYSYL